MGNPTKTLNVAMIGYGLMGRAHSNAFIQSSHFFDLSYKLNLKVICGRNESELEAMANQCPAIALAKQLIDEGRIGDPYHYRAVYLQSWGSDPHSPDAWRFRKAHAGSGVMGDLLSHSLDLAVLLNGAITSVTGLTKTFIPKCEVDDAVVALARFANGSIGTFEATRFATGCRNRNYFEIHGSKGAIRFDLEDLNRLQVFDRDDATHIQGSHNVLVTGPGHPYTERFWPPGHIIGYEHTFIATLVDFLDCLAHDKPFHANFGDAVEIQKLLEAVDHSCASGTWVAPN